MHINMKTFLPLLLIILLTGCLSEKSTDNTSTYARILDERVNRDLKNVIPSDSLKSMELYEFLDLTVTQLVEGSGGFNANGQLLNGETKGFPKQVFEQNNFFERLNQLLELEKPDSARYEYIRTGLLIVTQWPEYGLDKLTVTESYFGLTIAQNRLLTSNWVK